MTNKDYDFPYPGARWWKFDVHTHTPASADYGMGRHLAALRQITPRDWLLGYMRAGLDCVAVTDHNSGEWIDCLQEALQALKYEGHEDFRRLALFPGVEIKDARYMGRDTAARVAFSPWLNAVVGGRGTGKSTVLHALLLAARRQSELGDAEMVHALRFTNGQCVVGQSGSLQDAEIREEVCQIMEGGREAFSRRYRRLGKEPRGV